MTLPNETIATGAQPRCSDCGRMPRVDVYRSGFIDLPHPREG